MGGVPVAVGNLISKSHRYLKESMGLISSKESTPQPLKENQRGVGLKKRTHGDSASAYTGTGKRPLSGVGISGSSRVPSATRGATTRSSAAARRAKGVNPIDEDTDHEASGGVKLHTEDTSSRAEEINDELTVIKYLRNLPAKARNEIFLRSYTEQEAAQFIWSNITPDMFRELHRPESDPHFICPVAGELEACRTAQASAVEEIHQLKADAQRSEKEIGHHKSHIVDLETKRQLEHAAYKKKREESRETIAKLELRVQEADTLYVKAVSNVGTGLEPIADRTFSDKLKDHHLLVGQWCRRNLKGRKKKELGRLEPRIREILDECCAPDYQESLSLFKMAEIVFWNTLEAQILSTWFPTHAALQESPMCKLEALGETFSEDANSEERLLKVDFWRSYTTCLAFQSKAFPRWVSECVKYIVADVGGDVVSLIKTADDRPADAGCNMDDLAVIISDIIVTATELKCQRGLFDIEGIKPGMQYHSKTMDDCTAGTEWSDQERKKLVVKAVLSDGIIRRPHHKSTEAKGRACKARVIVGVADDA